MCINTAIIFFTFLSRCGLQTSQKHYFFLHTNTKVKYKIWAFTKCTVYVESLFWRQQSSYAQSVAVYTEVAKQFRFVNLRFSMCKKYAWKFQMYSSYLTPCKTCRLLSVGADELITEISRLLKCLQTRQLQNRFHKKRNATLLFYDQDVVVEDRGQQVCFYVWFILCFFSKLSLERTGSWCKKLFFITCDVRV